MKDVSPAYAGKISIAAECAALGCRAVTITAVARTRPSDSRSIYKKIWGQQSKPGQTPDNHEWFLASQDRRLHAAYLLMCYSMIRQQYRNIENSHGMAFTLTLRRYKKLPRHKNGADMLVSPERFSLLLGGYALDWMDILKGATSKFDGTNVKILRCRKCQVPHLVESHHITYVCAHADCN